MTIFNDLKQAYFDLAENEIILPDDIADLIKVEKEKLTFKKNCP